MSLGQESQSDTRIYAKIKTTDFCTFLKVRISLFDNCLIDPNHKKDTEKLSFEIHTVQRSSFPLQETTLDVTVQ